jgi:hypothetical protein
MTVLKGLGREGNSRSWPSFRTPSGASAVRGAVIHPEEGGLSENENALPVCEIRVAKKISKQECISIAALRREWFYEDPADPRYSRGGIHTLFTEAEMRAAYLKSRDGHFIMAWVDNGDLAGYARVTILSGRDRNFDVRLHHGPGREALSRAECLHTIVVSHGFCGRPVLSGGRTARLSDHLLNIVFALATGNQCQMVFCDVVSSPIQNDASIRLLAGEGFFHVGPSGTLVRRGGGTVELSRLAKVL